jgi:Domain of unknown function (DUF4173)
MSDQMEEHAGYQQGPGHWLALAHQRGLARQALAQQRAMGGRVVAVGIGRVPSGPKVPAGHVATPPGWAPLHGPPPPPPSLSGRHWPGPAGPPSRRVLAAVVVTGLAVAVAVPPDRAGVGWLVAALVAVGAMLAIGWRPLHPPGPVLTRRALIAESGWMPAAVALVAVAAVRDAEWLVALCALAAFGAGSLAVAGRSFRSAVRGALAVPIGALRGVGWVGRALVSVRRTATSLRLALSLLVGLALVAVFAALLTSADPAFARVLEAVLPTVHDDSVIAWVFRFAVGAAGLLGVAFLLAGPPTAKPPAQRVSRLRRAEWALPVGLLVALFALFVGVQLSTLFGTDAYVQATTGVTYAEYARGGFWQLLAVTVLTLLVIVTGRRWAAPDPVWTRLLFGALAVLTLVIVASALSRMWLYQQAYGFTVLRLLVLTIELWLGFGFVLTLAAVLRLRPGGPVRGMVAAGAVALLGLALLNPERFVAEHNITRYAETGKIDPGYLAELSADAVPALDRLPEPLRSCVLTPIWRQLGPAEDGGWRSANAGRAEARRILDGRITPSADRSPSCNDDRP